MAESARELMRRGTRLIAQSGVDSSSAALDSRRLLEHFCKITKTDMVLNPSVTPKPETDAQYIRACQKAGGRRTAPVHNRQLGVHGT